MYVIKILFDLIWKKKFRFVEIYFMLLVGVIVWVVYVLFLVFFLSIFRLKVVCWWKIYLMLFEKNLY